MWDHLLETSAYLSILAWLHLSVYLFCQLVVFVSDPAHSDLIAFSDLVHFIVVFLFCRVFYQIWRFGEESRSEPQDIMSSRGE